MSQDRLTRVQVRVAVRVIAALRTTSVSYSSVFEARHLPCRRFADVDAAVAGDDDDDDDDLATVYGYRTTTSPTVAEWRWPRRDRMSRRSASTAAESRPGP